MHMYGRKYMLKTMHNTNLCRICGKNTSEEDPLDLFEAKNKEILRQIRDLTGIRLKKNVNLPKYMCCICKKDLKEAFNFRENFLKIQALFKAKSSKINKKQTHKNLIEATEFVQVFVYKEEKNVTINKYEQMIAENEEKEINIIDSADLDKSHNSPKENKNEVNALELKPSEENTLEDTKIVKEEVTCSSNVVEHNSSKIISEDEENEIDDENKPDILPKILASNIYIQNSKNKKTAYAAADRSLISESSEVRKKSKKKHKDSEQHPNIFICDQCGNHFTCRQHFKLHLRRHTGDKRCACELCPDKFFTSSELRRHMRRHTGERPFACKYCERRFTDYSTRIKHERTHTNERPFMCSQCGKSFTTSYILKNHMLTHTGERQFKCEVCNRAFTRRTHLVVHFRSILHQQAIEKEKPSNSLEEMSQQNCLMHQATNTSAFIV